MFCYSILSPKGTCKPSKENAVVKSNSVIDLAIGWSKIYLLTSDGQLLMSDTSGVNQAETSGDVEVGQFIFYDLAINVVVLFTCD